MVLLTIFEIGMGRTEEGNAVPASVNDVHGPAYVGESYRHHVDENESETVSGSD